MDCGLERIKSQVSDQESIEPEAGTRERIVRLHGALGEAVQYVTVK